MRCEQVETRLNELLDRRQHWSCDRTLAAHCACCESCQSVAEAFAVLGDRVAAAPTHSQLSPDFASRVLGELGVVSSNAVQHSVAISIPGPRNVPRSRWLAIAAGIAIALPFGLLMPESSSLLPANFVVGSESPANAAWPLQQELAFLLDDDRQLSEVVWRSTGREFAKLPHQVRRAAEFSESGQLTGAIRPVAAAWQTLRRVLPGDSIPAAPASGETSIHLVDADSQWV